jgi:hypothetical protein
MLEDFYYHHGISNIIYKKLNKDKFVNKFFAVKYVGSCMQLISDFNKKSETKTHKDWETYYDNRIGFEKLNQISIRINVQYPHLDIDLVKRYVFFRVIGQTWNGYRKEFYIIDSLQKEFTNCTITKTDFEKDHEYCIDAEMHQNGNLVLGIQIKPISYKKMNTTYQLKAKENHKAKNDKYAKDYAPYVYVYYDKDEIVDKQETLNNINKIYAN